MTRTIVISNYKKYWVEDNVTDLDLRWKDRKRDKQKRVVNAKEN